MGITQELTQELFDPSYRDAESQTALGPYIKEGMNAVASHYANEGVKPPRFKGLKVALARLPTKMAYVIDRAGKIYPRVIGKVFGVYQPGERTLAIDPAVVYENDP